MKSKDKSSVLSNDRGETTWSLETQPHHDAQERQCQALITNGMNAMVTAGC